MEIDVKEFRDALGCFATGVTIITACSREGELIGITANSFNSVSLDPPLILFSLARSANSLRVFLATDYFAVNVLHEGQEDLSNKFARSSEDKWTGVEYETWDAGCPILPDALANFECRIRSNHDGGDHVLFVGEVVHMRAEPKDRPLLYYRGKYRNLDAAD